MPKPKIMTTRQRHRRQAFWQITLPLFLAAAVLVALAALAGVGTFRNPDLGIKWTGISIIMLTIPALLGGFLFIALLGAGVYGLAKLLNIIPTYSMIARSYVYKAALFVRSGADRLLKPFMLPSILKAGIRGFFLGLKNPPGHPKTFEELQ